MDIDHLVTSTQSTEKSQRKKKVKVNKNNLPVFRGQSSTIVSEKQ